MQSIKLNWTCHWRKNDTEPWIRHWRKIDTDREPWILSLGYVIGEKLILGLSSCCKTCRLPFWLKSTQGARSDTGS